MYLVFCSHWRIYILSMISRFSVEPNQPAWWKKHHLETGSAIQIVANKTNHDMNMIWNNMKWYGMILYDMPSMMMQTFQLTYHQLKPTFLDHFADLAVRFTHEYLTLVPTLKSKQHIDQNEGPYALQSFISLYPPQRIWGFSLWWIREEKYEWVEKNTLQT